MTISPTTVRASGYSMRGYGAIFTGALVLTASVTVTAAAQSVKSLSITISVGNISDVARGFRVQIFTSGGDFKGETHVRYAGTLDATHLPVREFSQTEFLILSGDVVKVFSLIAFADKLVEDTDLFNPDGIPVGTYNSAPPPLAGSGGCYAAFVDDGQTYATVLTDGSHSKKMASSGASTPTHVWTLVTGVAFAPGSGSTDTSPTLRVNQGEYTVKHVVTDPDNSQTWTQYVNYKIFDATHPPIDLVMETAPNGQDGLWSCTFRVNDNLTLTDAPDGSLFAFFVRERINGSWQSLGGASGRSAIKFVGYLSHDEIELTPQINILRFEAISALQRLKDLPGFSKVMLWNVTPNDWSEVQQITTLRAKVQIIRWYTTALDGNHDLNIASNYLDKYYPELWLQKESPFDQVNELADGVDARFTCNRSGQFQLYTFQPYVAPGDRASLNVVYTFGLRDILHLTVKRDHFDVIETLELHSTNATASGKTADALGVFTRAPGSPGHGSQFITVERIISGSQTGTDPQGDANSRGGRRFGWANKTFVDTSTGKKVRYVEIEATFRGVYDFLDFDGSIIQFASSVFTNPRNIELADVSWFMLHAQPDYGAGTIQYTFAPLTDSPAGATYIPPASPAPPVIAPPTPLPVIGTPDPLTLYGLPSSTGNIALFDSTNSAEWTGDLRLAYPVWTDTDLTLLSGWVGTLVQFILDAFATANGVLITSTKAFQLLAFGSSPSLANAHSFRDANSLRSMQSERSTKGLFVVVSYQLATVGSHGTDIEATSDSGVTWTRYTSVFGTWSGGPGDFLPPGCFVSAHVAGKVYTSGFTGAGVTTGAIYVSTNSGATWSRLNASSFYILAADITIPYQDSSESYVYHGGAQAVGGHTEFRLFKSNASGQTDISPTDPVTGHKFGAATPFSIKFCDVDARSGLLVGADNDVSTHRCVFLTRDGWATSTVIIPSGTSVPYTSGCFAGDNPNVIFLWGASGAFAVSTDGGVTFQDKTVSGGGSIVNIAGY